MAEADISTEAILEAALDSFAEHGYLGTSVRDIARSLGGSHNLIPNRIGSKEQLWYAAVDHAALQQYAALGLTFADEEVEGEYERLEALVARFISVNIEAPALIRVIAREAMTPGPRLDHLFDDWIAPVRRFGVGLLSSLREAGEVIVDSVGLVYFFMSFGGAGAAAFPALAERFGASVDASDPDAVRQVGKDAARLLFSGLLARNDEPVAPSGG